MHHQNGRLHYYDSAEEAVKLGVIFHTRYTKPAGNGLMAAATPTAMLGDSDPIEVWAADAWNWLKNAFEEVTSWEVRVFEEVTHFFFTLAEEIYHFAILIINDIVEGIRFVLNKIKIFFEDLVKWLGMIFSWNNYVRTHKVLRSLFINYTNYCIANIATAQNLLNKAANQAVSTIDQWAAITDGYAFPTDSYSNQASNTPDNGQNSPQANWGHQQAKNNAPSANYSGAAGIVGDLLDDFFKVINTEADIIAGAINQINEIISEASTTPIADLVKKILAVIADVVIESAVNVTDTLLDIAAQLIGDIVNDVLAASLNIPVISPLYKLFADEELSLLDLVCLVAAIPVNIIYEIATGMGSVPFPDNAQTNALINAPDLETFLKACTPPQLKSATALGDDPPPVWDDDTNAFWMKIANTCALVGSIGVSVFGGLKMKYSTGQVGYLIATLYGVCYLPYVAPDIIGVVQYGNNPNKYWYNDLNLALGITGLVKSFIDIRLTKPSVGATAVKKVSVLKVPKLAMVGEVDDPGAPPDLPPDPGTQPSGWTKPFKDGYSWNDASPFVECGINLLWEIPVAFAYVGTENDIKNKTSPYGAYVHENNVLTLVGNTLFNLGGAITPIGAFGPPLVSAVVFGVQVCCNLGYGIASCASSYISGPPKGPQD